MAFTNIIGRSLGRDVLNFGYSGQGYMETSVASFLVKVEDTGAFVIDCNPNMAHVDWCGICGSQDPTGTCACGGASEPHGGAGPGGIRNRTVPLVQFMRARGHPTTCVCYLYVHCFHTCVCLLHGCICVVMSWVDVCWGNSRVGISVAHHGF